MAGFTFGGFGQQNQTPAQQQPQQQQQQQQPAFGGFGTSTAFGTSTPAPAFGQPAQQQTGGGLFGGGGFGSNTTSTPAFGSTNTNTSTPGGGLFGNTQNTASTTPAFGGSSGFTFGARPPATTGGGLFGSAGQTNTGFGAPAVGTSTFGQQPANQGPATRPAAHIGAPNNSTDIKQGNDFGNPNHLWAPPSNGTADAPVEPSNPRRPLVWNDHRKYPDRKDDINAFNAQAADRFEDINALPMFWHTSIDELRLQDYQQGRGKGSGANAQNVGFGQSTSAFGMNAGGGFGQAANTTNNNAMGGGLFGNRAGTTGGGLFGSTGTGAFGKPATPAFGQSATGTTGGSLFGGNQQTGQTTSAFGSTGATSTFGGGFGQQNNQQQQQNKPTFGFGQTNTTQPSTGLFGAPSTSTPSFGQTNTQQPSGFSFGSNNNTANTTGGGLFGQQNKPATSLFGNNAATTANKPFSFGAPAATTQPTGGLFGGANQQQGQQQQQQPAAGGGLFGLGNNTATGTFGQQNNTAGTTGGLFGQQNKPTGTGLFGNTSTTSNPAPSFSFGGGQQQQNNNNQQQQQQPGATGGGLFGGGGGLFGNNTQNQQQQQQPQQQQATGGLFGGGATGGTGLFGSGSTGGGLFGNLNKPAAPAQQQTAGNFSLGQTSFGGFGLSQNNQQQQQPNQSSLFLGQSQPQQQQQQQPLQALNLSIDQNPYGNNPIFANVQPAKPSEGPRAYDADQPKKQVPLHISYRGTPRSSVKINKLRGFNTSSPGLGASRFGSPATPGTPLHASLTSLGNRAASASPAPLGNGILDLSLNLPPQAFPSRPSVKKLIIDKKHRESPDFLFGRKGSGTVTPVGEQTPEQPPRRVSSAFNPDAESSDRPAAPMSRDVSKQGTGSGSKSKSKAPAVNGNAVEDSKAAGRGATPAHSGKALQDGDYYTKPAFKALQSMPAEELSEVHDFVVGRVGFGEICWLEPVDLTGLASLRELLGEVVAIEDREVMVYPGNYEDEKPEEGQGLNLPAVISLKNCWPLDRSTREPIKDADHPRVKQHIKKLERKEETEFVDYEVSSGTWTFKVAHFSRYGLDSDDEGEGTETMQTDANASSPAVQRKKAIQQRRSVSRSAKKPRRTDSPVSDSTEDESMLDEAQEEEAPPRNTLDDDSEDEMAENSATERSYSRTPVLRSPSEERAPDEKASSVSDGEYRRRKRSVVVPTPRVVGKRRLPTVEPTEYGQNRAREQAPQALPDNTQQRPLPARLGLQPKRIAVMQASFFSKARQEDQTTEVPQSRPTPEVRQAIAVPKPRQQPLSTQRVDQAPQPDAVHYLPQYKPLRQWKAVPLAQSLVQGQEGKYGDFGLALGRSFRATFGPKGQLVTVGGLQRLATSTAPPQPTVVHILQPATLDAPLPTEQDAAAKALRIQHSFTDLSKEETGLPFAVTLPDLRFQHFADGFHVRDSSEEALLWRLGKALFDEIPLGLPEDVSAAVEDRLSQLRRRDAFSAWLREAVAASVEQDLRRSSGSSTSSTNFASVFALLTGNQVERACQAALVDGNVRLATLLAQAGGDEEFRADITAQISKWRESRADPLIDNDLRKIYEILSGNVNTSVGMKGSGQTDTSQDLKISHGLDWKRAFGLRFWYAQYQAGISNAVAEYDSDLREDKELARPVPAHKLSQPAESVWNLADDDSVRDVLYEFIKLYSDYRKPLEEALSSRASSSSPFSYRRAWHLYQVIAKSLRIRNFEDVGADGTSLLAEQLTLDYAAELEKLALWEWAIFILLHLSDANVREKAVRELLARNIHTLTDNLRSFLTENLAIPPSYLTESQTMRSLATGARDFDGPSL